MSPSRQLFTTLERAKKRKLSSSTVASQRKAFKMGLIQEVDTEPPSTTSIELNETESTIRDLFLDVAKYIEASSPSQDPIVLRFTGGWVRDKLLGVPSHDIDVAINNLTGLKFGQKLLEYLKIPGNPEKYGLEGVATTEKQDQSAAKADKSKMVRGLHKIAANPEKSKHLETVFTSVLGIDIDLVNLRKETYDEESRNPQMEFGTPEEDAQRRDATVNAMFYNLNTQQLEDLTGRGRTDMRDKLLRTPLEPYQTFMDDPLRVLRLIRFASRLGWPIESSALEAMQQSEIKSMLQKKISRERVGLELEKALRGPDPHEALRLILSLDLYTTIFCDPTTDTPAEFSPSLQRAEHTIDTLEAIFDEDVSLHTLMVRDSEERYLAWQLAALVPYRDAPLPGPLQPGRKALPPIASQVAREGIKATSKTCELVTTSIRNLGDIRSVVDRFYEQSRKIADRRTAPTVTTRDYLGMEIRRWGSTWRSQLLFALLADISDNPEQTEAYKRKYTNFLEHLRDLDILDAYQLKPLLDGKQLAKALNTAPGPWMKDALDVVMAWQLRNPGKTNTEEAIEEVKKQDQARQRD
ncbi:hypothetical protein AMS68_004478 [Peltaster fructicola]|uniref:Poly A polymerase head domain-containing protein n=1 Tax=Peltaster fructicola TaxID=286661 RepID=A0A6H0XWC1_9PEZI|nr:hypothetical protein AMS68_004478 [Peltaster fructicola]